MLYGLSGSAGVGKTTLAKAIAEDLGITYMPTSITECAKRHGFNAVGPMSISDRIKLQYKLLEDHVEMIAAAPRPLIVDRTPIDMIGYILSEFDMHSHLRATAEEIYMVEEYVELCLDMASKLYDYVFLLGQLETYEISNTRPADNRAYQTHTQFVMMGALQRLHSIMNYAVVPIQDLEDRKAFVHDHIVKRMNEIEVEKKSSAHIH